MAHQAKAHDAEATDPGLLSNHSVLKTYSTSRFTYPELRVFYRQHPKARELPSDPAPLPLLVFIHGLGGSVAQFHPLLTSLTNNASCLALDFPGCGRSAFAPADWDAYGTDALLELLELVIDDYRDKENGQGVVLIAHSMGTAMAARLANRKASHMTAIADYVLGICAICPVAGPPSEEKVVWFRRALWIPTFLFDLLRWWDQWGGPDSASVNRFLGPEADRPSRLLQYRFNRQSRTDVFRRMAWGSLPKHVGGNPTGGLFGEPAWTGLQIPVLLVGGEKDNVTSPAEVAKIVKMLEPQAAIAGLDGISEGRCIVESAAPIATTSKPTEHLPQSIKGITAKHFEKASSLTGTEESYEEPTTPRDSTTAPAAIPPQPRHPKKVVKCIVMPAPATHGLLFTPKTVRTLSGLICNFLSEQITGRLELGWQLQYLSKEGKWDVKNLAKWKSVQPVSAPIEGIFRAMKTLREVDEEHSPKFFVPKYGKVIKDVIDISHDNPVYNAQGLEELSNYDIKYHKFPTVSKIPPTDQEVEGFIGLVSRAPRPFHGPQPSATRRGSGDISCHVPKRADAEAGRSYSRRPKGQGGCRLGGILRGSSLPLWIQPHRLLYRLLPG